MKEINKYIKVSNREYRKLGGFLGKRACPHKMTGEIVDPYLYQNFKLYTPSYVMDEMRSIEQISPTEIEVLLDDDTRIIYDDTMNGIYIERDHSEDNPRTSDQWRLEFAKRLAHAMRRTGYSQTDLANMLNVSPVMINGWVKGKHLPRLDMAIKIAHILKYPVDKLVDFW